MAESNSRWLACARVPFLPVPLRARADGWTPARRRRAGAASFAHGWDTVIAVHRGKSLRLVDFPKRKITPEELAELAGEGPFHVPPRRGRFVRAVRKPSVSALLRHLRPLCAAAVRGGWGW
jgi:hypothetical protein